MDKSTNTPIDIDAAKKLAAEHGTPLYVYSAQWLRSRAKEIISLQAPYELTVRYAVKANPHPEIVRMFAGAGLHFDVSSSYEAADLLEQGVPGGRISLSSQQPAHNLDDLLKADVKYVATSMHQLELFAAAEGRPGAVGLRINPGIGHGHNNRVTTGGLASSFGLWHDYVPKALLFAKEQGITIDRLQVHIGSSSDPARWGEFMEYGLAIAETMPDVAVLNMGGGFKIAYNNDDLEADMQLIEETFNRLLTEFAKKTGRELRLEIEPGRWLVAHCGVLLTEIVDVVDTGADGHIFLRTDTGMNDFMRPAMYGSQHRIAVLNDATEQLEYLVVGHNCETGDILTPAPFDPEGIHSRLLNRAAIGDLLAIYDTGAYCAAMSAKGYNAYPNAKEIII